MAALGAPTMRSTLLLIAIFLISSCTEDTAISYDETYSEELGNILEVEDIRTYEELRSYLDRKYINVEELPVAALIESGADTIVPYKYRLQNGKEFTVPIVFTASNERIVDPEFNLHSLPDGRGQTE